MRQAGQPPGNEEFELTLLGPGYGESILLHIGDGVWVLVDSCVDTDRNPRALQYLESIDVNPAKSVALVVATHWHDDHIRGIARLVEVCHQAKVCLANVLCEKEILVAAHALEDRDFSGSGSGLRELYHVISQLKHASSRGIFATADRRLFLRGACEIWSLSPSDSSYLKFLQTIGGLLPSEGDSPTRIPSQSPNEVSVVLWVKINDIAVLLGSDLEKRGWAQILQRTTRPPGKASAFKVPHHGSKNAHEPGVWEQMLDADPFAVLTPWHRGNRKLPSQQDAQRILSCTTNAYATANSSTRRAMKRGNMIKRTIRESGIKLRKLAMAPGIVRIRHPLESQTNWKVETFGAACHLEDFARQ